MNIWLYPLNKLMPPKSTMVKMPGNYLSISRELVLRCQIMLGRWEMFRVETDLLVTEVDKLQWRAVSQRARHFQKHVYQECKETKEDEGVNPLSVESVFKQSRP